MIYFVIFVLLIVLCALFIDWPQLTKRWLNNKQGGMGGLKKAAFKRNSALPEAKTENKGKEIFDFQDEIQDLPTEKIKQYSVNQPVKELLYSEEVQSLLAQADIHFRKGEMKLAEDLYVQAAAKDPRCSKAYSRLGVIYLEQGENFEDAEAAFRQALKIEPHNGNILNNLGLVLYHQDKYADAIRQFEQSVRQDEFNASRHANLGMAYMAMRQYAKAESSFKKALKLAPNELEYKDLLNESIEKKKAHKTMIRR